MVHFIVHVSNLDEIERLPSLRVELQKHFPASLLHVFNQTLLPVADTLVCENIKNCGFGWTVRFLRYALSVMAKDDVVVKIDPDTLILGNPLAGVALLQGCVFGERQVEDCCASVFYGGFQGYTYDAVKAFVTHGHIFENEVGPQDIAAQYLINLFEIPFIGLSRIALWDTGDNPGTNLVWHRSNQVPRIRNCK